MSTATMDRLKVIAACESCIRAVDGARHSYREAAICRIQKGWWGYERSRGAAIARLENPSCHSEYLTERLECKHLHGDAREAAERIRNLARASDAYTMEISDKDFALIGKYYS